MKRMLVVVLLLSHLARAADDAPVVTPLVPGFVCIPEGQRVREGKAYASCDAERSDLKKGNVIMTTPAFIGTISGSVALAIALGVAIGVAAGKKP